jgi:PKD repeat protein
LNKNKLKAKKRNSTLRELFRHKLKNAEVMPSPVAGVKLMRKLALKEFLHLNPFRFNIYYLGGIIIGTVGGIAILTSGPEREPGFISEEIHKELSLKDTIEIVQPVTIQAPKNKPIVKIGRKPLHVRANPVVPDKAAGEKAILHTADSVDKNVPAPNVLNQSLKGKDLFARTTEDNLKLQAKSPVDEAIFTASVTAGCAPLKVLFQNNQTGYDSCLWTFGDGGSSVSGKPEWIYDIDGDYKVVLKVFNQGGLVSASSAMISVAPKPTARFEFSPEKSVIPDYQIRFQNYSANAVKYFWSFGDGSTSEQFEPLHRYEGFGNYNVILKAYSENGCSDSLVVFNVFSDSAYFIEFPNAFFPDTGGPSGGAYSIKSDETGKIFHPTFSGVSQYQLKIFSKLGVLVFESSDINSGWDGYYQGQLSNTGVYIWKVKGNFSNGEPFTRMGDVTLLKK